MNATDAIRTSDILKQKVNVIGRQALIRHMDQYPEQFDTGSLEEYLQHIRNILSCLSVSLRYSSPLLMKDWLSYCEIVTRGSYEMQSILEVLEYILSQNLEKDQLILVRNYLFSSEKMPGLSEEEAEDFLEFGNPLKHLARRYMDLLLEGFRHEATELILKNADNGLSAREIYRYVFQPSQLEVGRLWQKSIISPSVEHYFTAATQLNMSLLYGRIFSAERIGKKILAASVANELHEIGVRMVSDFFEMEGWDTFYLGAGTPTDSILKMAEQHAVSVLCISATMAANVQEVENVIQTVREELRRRILILVGGRSFQIDPSLYKKIGADATAATAWDSVDLAIRLEVKAE